MARIVAAQIDYHPGEAELFLKIVAANNYFKKAETRKLLSTGQKRALQQRARQYEEMNFATKNHLLERELAKLPTTKNMNLKYKAAEETFLNMGMNKRLSLPQMKLLASKLKMYTIPRNDFVVRSHDVISGIIIIKEGIFDILPDAEAINHSRGSNWTEGGTYSADDEENKNQNLNNDDRGKAGVNNNSNKNKNRKFSKIFIRSDQLKQGDCVGVGRGYICKGYDFWICSLKAHVPSVVFILESADIQLLTRDHGRKFEKVMSLLYEYVGDTIFKVDHCFTQFDLLRQKKKMKERGGGGGGGGGEGRGRSEGGDKEDGERGDDLPSQLSSVSVKKNIKDKYKDYKNNRTIFHPCENVVNIFFIVTSILKTFCFGFLFIYVAFDIEAYNEAKPCWFMYYVVVITLNVITVAEMIFKLHVGFIEKSGKVVTYPYHVWQVWKLCYTIMFVEVIEIDDRCHKIRLSPSRKKS